jgi:hypothetical protein
MKIRCKANDTLFETRQSKDATREERITIYKTVTGKGWNVLMRLYSPLRTWFDKTLEARRVFELVK